ncbi:transporter [Boudabousia tangfeifanii]|uniref:Transporter n=1 Tax=Boudabousia tangfeifanii TaxID=1912795 RepID=A0A1D9MLK4_9ACTO|nr:TrkA C-terminal domain-containing protein [Boudabousia tangfeifanii]AOZ73155.1 transporter [Boudabousia tangfeifanii]
MSAMLVASPLLTVFLVVALGAVVGAINFGPLRFGAAGALFVGLFVGAMLPESAHGLDMVKTLGLALFVYMAGLSAGHTFFRDLKTHAKFLTISVGILIATAVAVVFAGESMGLSRSLTLGLYAGALTTTPAMAATTTGEGAKAAAETGVGYALAYPIGVIIAIALVALIVNRDWPGKGDQPPQNDKVIRAITVAVKHEIPVREVPGFAEDELLMSYLRRGKVTRVVAPGETLFPGDLIVFVGDDEALAAAVKVTGEELDEHLADDRSEVEVQRLVISNPELAGRTVASMNLAGKFGAVVTRVRRGDTELLAVADLELELGDAVVAVARRKELDALTRYFGDSQLKISQVGAIPIGIGMVLGLGLGLIHFPLPGGSFTMGSAAGPLIVGILLGALGRTGPLVWVPPQAAGLVIRQIGLLLFLSTIGLISGPAFAEQAVTMTGVKVGILGAGVVLMVSLGVMLTGWLMGHSAQRTAGWIAGVIGQPAILSYAQSRSDDDRIENAYMALFALGMVVKILITQIASVL